MNIGKAIGSKVKIMILYQLWKAKEREEPILFEKEIAQKTGVSQAAVGKMSKGLILSRLIEVEEKGRMKFYKLKESRLTEKLAEFFQEWERSK